MTNEHEEELTVVFSPEVAALMQMSPAERLRAGGVSGGIMAKPCQMPVGDGVCGQPRYGDHGTHTYSPVARRHVEPVEGYYSRMPDAADVGIVPPVRTAMRIEMETAIIKANYRMDREEGS